MRLNWDKVKEIRASSATLRELADRFGVHYITIWNVRNHKTWKEEECR